MVGGYVNCSSRSSRPGLSVRPSCSGRQGPFYLPGQPVSPPTDQHSPEMTLNPLLQPAPLTQGALDLQVASALLSWGRCNKSLQTQWLTIFSLTVLETASPKSSCWQGCTSSKDSEGWVMSCFSQLWGTLEFLAWGCITPVPACLHVASFSVS